MLRAIILTAAIAWLGSASAINSERGTPDEARALAERAATVLGAATEGREQVLERFTAPHTEFVDRDLYVFVMDLDGNLLANGNNPRMVGKNVIKLKDVRGQFIARNAIETAVQKSAGWTPVYHYPDPISKKIGEKQSYVIRVGDLIVGVGFYKPS